MLKISAKVLVFYNNYLLLLQRSSTSKSNKFKWEIPGGKIDKKEVPEQGGKREVEEETGLDIKIIGKIERYSTLGKTTCIFYATTKTQKITLSQEHCNYAWILPEQIDNYDVVDKQLVIISLKKIYSNHPFY